MCILVLISQNNFWTKVNRPQQSQQSVWLPAGVDKVPTAGPSWLLVFISFPSVTPSDSIVLTYVCGAKRLTVYFCSVLSNSMKIFLC